MHHFALLMATERQHALLAEARASALAAEVPARPRPPRTRRVRSVWTSVLDVITARPYRRRTA